ncbi:hypothetical protein QJS10_CPA05g02385 [Acorus calamus]|uniref:Uncharacterized protein n=1 Tax=Acorus calamus TaxID=4465 RepID=A0AAV9EY09_ACOCL|nr:hypothetical protein QJS10_CPA05g02385 [Acorus calamus]
MNPKERIKSSATRSPRKAGRDIRTIEAIEKMQVNEMKIGLTREGATARAGPARLHGP